MKLDEMTKETFEPHIGSMFTVRFRDAEAVQLKLARVALVMERVRSEKLKRQPFTLFFQAPDSFYLPQQMYNFSHEALGENLPIFIVPIGRQEGMYTYEAVFT